jgi:4-hydroxy-2-oxoheptanedioate aldolase
MRPNALRGMLRDGSCATTAWVSMPSTYLAEVLSHCGFDAVTIDLQHGMFALDQAVALLQAVSAGPAVPMARCARLDEAEIGKLLDAGAYGIICPSIDRAEDCERFVAACRYPPIGARSYGPARGLLYGGPDYVSSADATIMTWAMVESVTALDHLDAILAVPGLDGVYVGPNDLALSLGLPPGGLEPPPAVEQALAAVLAAAHARGVAVGAFCPTASMARRLATDGFDLVTAGNDVTMMRDAASGRLAEIRGSWPPSDHSPGY